MRVTTWVADMAISLDRLKVGEGALVLTGSGTGGTSVRVVMDSGDVRQLLAALFRPRILGFLLASLFRSGKPAENGGGVDEHHPSPVTW